MISFKQFLTESRYAPLYHGTSVFKLQSIIKNGIDPKTEQPARELLMPTHRSHVIRGISLTRNKKFAIQWAITNNGEYAVLEFDSDKLKRRYRIIPFQYWQGAGRNTRVKEVPFGDKIRNEYEEFLISDKHIPLNYVTAIYVHPTDVEFITHEIQSKYPHIQINPTGGK